MAIGSFMGRVFTVSHTKIFTPSNLKGSTGSDWATHEVVGGKDTKECYDGVTYTTITALFRAYDSWAESVADHSAFLLANKRYAAVVGERDYKAACKAIKAAGYATDPGYPQKLIGLIEKYGLTVYDGKAEQEDKTSMNISITKKTSTHNTTAVAGRAIRYIVVHYTAGVTSKPGSAAGTASYFGSTPKWVSADFIVDDGGAVQYKPALVQLPPAGRSAAARTPAPPRATLR